MDDQPTTGSLDTNVRLLAQRVTLGEADLKRLGDSVRQNSREINKLEANTSQNDKLLSYRLDDLSKKVDEMNRGLKEAAKEFRQWALGLLSGLVITFLMALFDLLRGR